MQKFLSNAIPAIIIIMVTLTPCYFALQAVTAETKSCLLTVSLSAFAWTYFGFWGYSAYYATKSPHSALYAGIYTLFFTPYAIVVISACLHHSLCKKDDDSNKPQT